MAHTRRRTLSLGAAVLLVALPGAGRAQDWFSAFPPDPRCRAVVSLDRAPRSSESRMGGLVVLVRQFGSDAPFHGIGLQIRALSRDTLISGPVYLTTPEGRRMFDSLPPGRHALSTRAIGFWSPRLDTVDVRAGAVDTILIRLETFYEGYRNVYNCRPRRFRRAGETACLPDSEHAAILIQRAREMASDEQRRALKLPPFSEDDIALVRDEEVCERASRAYGRPGDPPRRMIVVRMGPLYMVYDPNEPRYAGEWDTISIFDAMWGHVLNLAT